MKVTSLKVLLRVLVFGLLLGASSTAYADTVVITSFNFGNLQFTPASGTAVFTPTAASARANSQNSLGANQNIISNTFPLAQSTATVTFASAAATGNATNSTVNANTSVNLGDCSCTASSFGQATFSGTLVITGGEGNVDVTISFVPSAMGQVMTDQFGVFAEASVTFQVLLNGVAVFSQDELLRDVIGPNQTGGFQLVAREVSKTFPLQFGAVNTFEVRFNATSAAVNEVPEPATVVLLVSGLGLMSGLWNKRRKTPDE